MQTDAKHNRLDEPKRSDWDYNNNLITKALMTYIAKHERRPTNTELSKLTGLSRSTITRHFQDIDHHEILRSEVQHMQLLIEPVMVAIVNSALYGNTRSQLLYLQLAFGWTKPTRFKLQETPTPEPLPETAQEIDEIIATLTQYRDDMKRLKAARN